MPRVTKKNKPSSPIKGTRKNAIKPSTCKLRENYGEYSRENSYGENTMYDLLDLKDYYAKSLPKLYSALKKYSATDKDRLEAYYTRQMKGWYSDEVSPQFNKLLIQICKHTARIPSKSLKAGYEYYQNLIVYDVLNTWKPSDMQTELRLGNGKMEIQRYYHLILQYSKC
jgi:hypothetical protein